MLNQLPNKIKAETIFTYKLFQFANPFGVMELVQYIFVTI